MSPPSGMSLGEMVVTYVNMFVVQCLGCALVSYLVPRKRFQNEEPEIASGGNERSSPRKRIKLDGVTTAEQHEEGVLAADMQHNEEVRAPVQDIADSNEEFASAAVQHEEEVPAAVQQEEEVPAAVQQEEEDEHFLAATQYVAESDQEDEQVCATQLVSETEDEEEENPEATQWANCDDDAAASTLQEEVPIIPNTPPPHEVIEISDDEEEEEEDYIGSKPTNTDVLRAMEKPTSPKSQIILQQHHDWMRWKSKFFDK